MAKNSKQLPDNLKIVFDILTIAFFRYLSDYKQESLNKRLEFNLNVSINESKNNSKEEGNHYAT